MLNGNLKNLSREREVHMAYYTQLTQEERYHIPVLCKERFSRAEIARRLNRHPSTIIRKLKRNTGKRGYRDKQAHYNASYRRHTAKKAIKLTHETIKLINEKIREKWSPEQISGWLRRIQIYISHERIYQFLFEKNVKGVNCINIYDDPIGNIRNVMVAQIDDGRYQAGYL